LACLQLIEYRDAFLQAFQSFERNPNSIGARLPRFPKPFKRIGGKVNPDLALGNSPYQVMSIDSKVPDSSASELLKQLGTRPILTFAQKTINNEPEKLWCQLDDILFTALGCATPHRANRVNH